MFVRRTLIAFLLILGASAAGLRGEENPDFVRGHALYQHGKGDPSDFPVAMTAFNKAAESGHARSQFYIGRMYQLGDGVPVDLKKAERWYRLAGGNNDEFAWCNLGNVLGALGRSPEDILECYTRSSELGYAMGSYNVGQARKSGFHGIRRDWVEANTYYLKALEQQADYPGAWDNIGTMYHEGGFGLERDFAAAERAYLKSVETTQYPHSYYNLYRLYRFGRRPSKPGQALEYLLQAAEHGHAHGAERAAATFRFGWGVEPDFVKAAHFYDLGAKANHGGCNAELNSLADDKRLIDHYGKETTNGWKARYDRFKKRAAKEVGADLPEIRRAFDEHRQESAKVAIDAAFERWKTVTVDAYVFAHCEAVWWEAQVASGRATPEWSAFLFRWLTEFHESDKRAGENVIGARLNLNSSLLELGQYGLLRESCNELKRLFREIEGVDFDVARSAVSIGHEYQVIGADRIPLKVDAGLALRSRKIDYWCKPKNGEWIGGQAVTMLAALAEERLSVGDWESVLFIAEWTERWVRGLNESGDEPVRSYPGCVPEVEQSAMRLRAEAFSALGLLEREAAAWQTLVDMKYFNSYGGRQWHLANYRLATVRIAQGRTAEVDPSRLVQFENWMRANRQDHSHQWQFAKLVRARVLAETKGLDAGVSLVREVLDATLKDERPRLRLEALLVSAEIHLNAGQADGVADSLEEALDWARGKGLLLDELRIYQLYVRYLCATGDYDQAVEMQRRVLALIEGLKLSPRREAAVARLAEITALRGKASATRVADAPTADPDAETAAAGKDQSQGDDSGQAAPPIATQSLVELQPLGIRTMPSRETAEAIFLLSNLSSTQCSVKLSLRSPSLGFAVEHVTDDELAVACTAGGSPTNLSVDIDLPAGGPLPVILTARGLDGVNGECLVTLQVQDPQAPAMPASEWRISPDGQESSVTVIDAAVLRHNAFSLVPVYHHLSAPEGRSSSIAMRVTASEPSRVEGFSADGTLLFVDAQGNGSFRDPGDLIATDTMDELYPLLTTGEEDAIIALRYRPESGCANGRVEIRIETREAGSKAEWKTDAMDWLEP